MIALMASGAVAMVVMYLAVLVIDSRDRHRRGRSDEQPYNSERGIW